MRIISRKKLVDFWTVHADAALALQLWFKTVEKATWTSPADVKAVYRSADPIANDRIVFDIKGNKYRVVAHVRYGKQLVYIRFIGTHAEYDKINATTV